MVRRRCAARLDADFPAARLHLHGELRQVRSNIVVVGADIGDTQGFVLIEKIGVPRQNGNPGLLRALERSRHGSRIRRRHGDAVDLFRNQVVDDLNLLIAAAMLAGPDIDALDGAGELLLGFLAPVTGLIEKRVVHVFRYERERVFLPLRLSAGTHRKKGRSCDT